jgi:putative hemin transport protein
MTMYGYSSATEQSLEARWREYRQQHPNVWIRDAAEVLGVSEAELLALGCGGGVTRLSGRWKALLELLPALGEVKTMTRNASAVIEKWGRYERVEIAGNLGQVVGDDIDLRLFMHHWKSGYAVREEGKHGLRHSLQFFDGSGASIHKVYIEDEGTLHAYGEMVRGFTSSDQSPRAVVEPPPAAAAPRPDVEVDTAGLCDAWDRMQDTHEFFGVLRTFGVTRAQAFRIGGPGRARRVVPSTAAARILEDAAAGAMTIMCFVGSRGALQIHTGPVRHIRPMGAWLNVLDPRFNLHLREDRIAEAWVVKKPTKDGIVTSLELFNVEGETIAMFFGKRKPGELESEAWRRATGALDEEVRP